MVTIGFYRHGLTRQGSTLALIIVMVALCLAGCLAGSSARLMKSREVALNFETYKIYPGHRYFYLKQENAPYALIALRDEYSISSMSWYELDPESEDFPETVDFAKAVAQDRYYPMGMVIMGPEGNPIAYWYSGLRILGIRVNKETMSVSINTETPWLDDSRFGG